MKAHLSLGIAAFALALSGCSGDEDGDLNAVARQLSGAIEWDG